MAVVVAGGAAEMSEEERNEHVGRALRRVAWKLEAKQEESLGSGAGVGVTDRGAGIACFFAVCLMLFAGALALILVFGFGMGDHWRGTSANATAS